MKKSVGDVEAQFLDLGWLRLRGTFRCRKSSGVMKSHPLSVVQAIVKGVSSRASGFRSLAAEDLPIFHMTGKPHTFRLRTGDFLDVEFLFFGRSAAETEEWREALEGYMAEPEERKTLELVRLAEVEERDYSTLKRETPLMDGAEELCLEFLSPLPFKPVEGKHRGVISESGFIRLLQNRFEVLFGRPFEAAELNGCRILPYYWNFTEFFHASHSQPGTTQRIKGMVGKLYLKGDWRPLAPFLILGSELHAGSKRSNSQGYFRLLEKSPAFFKLKFPRPNDMAAVIQDVLQRYDQAAEALSLERGRPLDPEELAAELCREIKAERYTPSPNTAFSIRQEGKTERMVEQLSFRDLMVCQYVHKTLYKILDNCFEDESCGFRKGLSRAVARQRIEVAAKEGFLWVAEADIEDFFPSIDLQRVEALLDRYLPAADRLLKDLVSRIIRTGYVLNGKLNQRLRGLPVGNPLSPTLANLYLDDFDEAVKGPEVRLVRYGDDFIILCRSEQEAREALSQARHILSQTGLSLKDAKTAIKPLSAGFDFLGYRFDSSGIAREMDPNHRPYRKPLYITEPFVFIGLNGNSLVVKKNKRVIHSVPLRRVSEIMVMDTAVISTNLLKVCTQEQIPLTVTLSNGYYITTIKPDSRRYYDIAARQAKAYDALSDSEKLGLASDCAAAKIGNSIAWLKVKFRGKANERLDELYTFLSRIRSAHTVQEVRGLEGMAARKVFAAFDQLIIEPAFKMDKRQRKKPDRINSLFNFGYYLLFSRLNAAVRASGLNPYLGFLHSPMNSYESLVCDLQEPFRCHIDRFILRLVNLRVIREEDFCDSRHGYFLKQEGVRKFLSHFEAYINRASSAADLTIKEHLALQVEIVEQWALRNQSLTFFSIK